MFSGVRTTLRAFALGALVGVLFAPRPGAQTRKMLNERITKAVNSFLEIAALPPIQPDRAATNGHSDRASVKRERGAGTDARTSSQ
jgi:hypothetical protein